MSGWEFAKQIIHMLITLIGISMLIFVLSRVIPGDPVRLALGPEASEEQVENMRQTLGFDKPLIIQYFNLITDIFRGKMGMSTNSRRDVSKDLPEYFPATLELVIVAMFIAILGGVSLGVNAALNKDGLVDNINRIFAFGIISFPQFWTGIMLQLLFSWILGVLPFSGRLSGTPPSHITGLYLIDSLLTGNFQAFADSLKHIILPAITLSLSLNAQITRLIRANMIEEMTKDYIKVMSILGMPKTLVVYKYMLKNALTSTLTVIGLSFGFMIGNCFVVEVVFAWPGLAAYGLNAMLSTDFNGMIGVTVIVGLGVLIANFAVDLIYTYLDPRIRLER